MDVGADKLLSGNQYNNGMRALKYLYNAFVQLKIEHLKEWLKGQNNHPSFESVEKSNEFKQLINEVIYVKVRQHG